MEALMHDATFWTAVAFVIFVALAAWKGRGAAANAVSGRIRRIQGTLDDAVALKEEAQRYLAEMRRRQREVVTQTEEMAAQAEAEAKAIKSQARLHFREEIARRETLARARISHAEADAARMVHDLMADCALVEAERTLRRRLAGPGGDALLAAARRALQTQAR